MSYADDCDGTRVSEAAGSTQQRSTSGQGRKSVGMLVRELKTAIRQRTGAGVRHLIWSLHVADLTDADLQAVLESMARAGVHGTVERDYATVAHFNLRW